jgi:hypothetical protein
MILNRHDIRVLKNPKSDQHCMHLFRSAEFFFHQVYSFLSPFVKSSQKNGLVCIKQDVENTSKTRTEVGRTQKGRNNRDTYLEQQETEKIETEVRSVNRILITEVYACCPGWHSGGGGGS